MYERFTDRARVVVVRSQEEARLLNHNYIGTEHLLLALVHTPCRAMRILDASGVSLDHVIADVVARIKLGKRTPSGHIPFTPRAVRSFEFSFREALALEHSHIGTEHLLLGLILDPKSTAAQVLVGMGLEPESLRVAVKHELDDAGGPSEVS